MTFTEHEQEARKKLAAARVDSPGLCSRILAAHAANLSPTQYIISCRDEMSPAQAALFADLVARRASGEPLAYILGQKEFYSLDFYVDSSVLTPRPETELLIDLALDLAPASTPASFADIGCGSGCIGITILHYRPLWRGILVDLSLPALNVAAKNIYRHGTEAVLIQADICHLPFAAHSLDIIVSNPPYIDPAERSTVMWETLAYEPHSALFSSCGGLRHLSAIIAQSAQILQPYGWLLLEHGATQGERVRMLLQESGFSHIELYHDLAGLPRCTAAQIVNTG